MDLRALWAALRRIGRAPRPTSAGAGRPAPPAAGSPVPPGLEATPGIIRLYEQIGPRYPWYVSIVSVLGSFATLLTATIVNVAIPDIMGALGMTMDEAQNLVSAFLAAGTITMLMTAWCIRAFGIAKTYVFCIGVFIASSVLGGIAATAEALFLARLLQGAASGVVTPLTMVLIAQVFPVSKRGMGMGLMGVGTVLAPALGPTIGGYLVDNLSWRWVFYVAIPFAAASLPFALTLFPAREERGPRPPFDWAGLVLCSTFLTALLVALTEAQSEGWHDDRVVIALALGAVAFVAWLGWETKAAQPLLDMRLFRNGRFASAAFVTFTVGAGLYGSTYVFPLFLQGVSRLIPTDAGLMMAPAGLAMAALFPLSGYLADRVSARSLVTVGLALVAWACWLMRDADAFTPLLDMVIWYTIGRLGMAFIFPGLNAAAVNALPLELIPAGSGMINFLRQFGGALGVNALSFVLIQRSAEHQLRAMETQTWDNSAMMELMRLAQEQLAYLGLVGYQAFELSFTYVLAVVNQQSDMLGYRESFIALAIVLALSILPTWTMGPNRPLRDGR